MNNDTAGQLEEQHLWIEANDLKLLRRLYFMDNRLIVIRALHSVYIVMIPVIIIIMIALNFVTISEFDFLTGLLFIGIFGGLGGLLGGVIQKISKMTYENKLKGISPDEMLKIDKKNYVLNYSEISNIWVKFDPNTLGKRNAELLIDTIDKKYKFIIFAKFVRETVEKVEQLNRPATKKRTKLKLKSPIDQDIEQQGV
jgi:hypothetical protein